jgi:hypothetical protein
MAKGRPSNDRSTASSPARDWGLRKVSSGDCHALETVSDAILAVAGASKNGKHRHNESQSGKILFKLCGKSRGTSLKGIPSTVKTRST